MRTFQIKDVLSLPGTTQAAQASGDFASADLVAEGFIHCCTAQQIAAVANRYYQYMFRSVS